MTLPLASNTFPQLLRFLPMLLVPIALLRSALAWRSGQREPLERVLILSIYAIATALTIVNRPDFIHIAFVGIVFWIFGAESLQRGVSAMPAAPRRFAEQALPVAGLALAVAASLHLASLLEAQRERFDLRLETAFGELAYANEERVRQVEIVRAALDAADNRDLFAYPLAPSLLLAADAHNPARHDLLFPKYKSDEQYDEVFEALDRVRVEYIVVLATGLDETNDRMIAFVKQRYRCADDASPCWLYRRND